MIFFLLSLNVSAGSPTWGQLHSKQGWTLSKTIENAVGTVEVWSKEIEGIPCFVGKAESDVDVMILLEVARDIEGSLSWSTADLQESVTLRRSRVQMDYYQRINIPFVSNRHWFLRGITEHHKNEVFFHWDRLIDGGPHHDFYSEKINSHPSAVEPPINVGGWSFTKEDEQVTVRYYICTHPGGLVPQQFQAIGTARTLPNNLRDLIIEGRNRAQ